MMEAMGGIFGSKLVALVLLLGRGGGGVALKVGSRAGAGAGRSSLAEGLRKALKTRRKRKGLAGGRGRPTGFFLSRKRRAMARPEGKGKGKKKGKSEKQPRADAAVLGVPVVPAVTLVAAEEAVAPLVQGPLRHAQFYAPQLERLLLVTAAAVVMAIWKISPTRTPR